MAVFLVNLPFVHETWTGHQVAQRGREVQASVLDARPAAGKYFVDYRLPRSVDSRGTRYSAQVDHTTYEQARESHAILVRVVPGKPGDNRPEGYVGNSLLLVVAVIGDLILLLIGVLGYRRLRERVLHTVVSVDGDEVTLESHRGELTVLGPDGWAAGLQPGQRVGGGLHVVAEHEVVPGGFVGGFEQVHGATYVVHGRVLDARAGRLTLELSDRSRLDVETGQHRIRADIRDPTDVRGTLCFTPSGVSRRA